LNLSIVTKASETRQILRKCDYGGFPRHVPEDLKKVSETSFRSVENGFPRQVSEKVEIRFPRPVSEGCKIGF
jgi:hypothetical protein